MYLLEKFHLVQFFLCSAQTLHFGASCGIVAPNGSGKSAVLDAMQIVLHGGDQRAIDLNAQSGGASGSDGRSIREYCLGFYRGEDHVRNHATTYLTMVFRDTTGKLPPVSVGVALGASINEPKHRIYGWYNVAGVELTLEDHLETLSNGDPVPLDWTTFKAAIAEKSQQSSGQFYAAKNASDHVQAMLFRLRPHSSRDVSPSAFTKGLKNALNLKTVADASAFVRDYIVEARPIDLKDFREQLDSFRKLKAKVQEVIERIAKADAMLDTNKKALKARMRQATYGAMVAEFQRDIHMEQREEAETLAAAADRNLVSAGKEADRFRLAHDRSANEFIELSRQANSDPTLLAAKDLQQERLSALTPIKRNLGNELRKIVAAYADAGKRDEFDNEWDRLARPWDQLLSLVQSTAADAPLDIDTASVVADLRQIGERTRPLLARARQVETEDAQRFKDLKLKFSVASEQFKRAQQGKNELTGAMPTIRQLLAEQGIDSTPVCDLVTVTDPSWAPAVESFLGKNSTALLIEFGRLQDALRVYEKIPASYNPFGVMLVKPQHRRVDREALPEKALAHLIDGSDPDAIDFICSKLRRLEQLDLVTPDSPEGLTREGMQVSHDSFGRRRPTVATELVLGRQDQRAKAAQLAHAKTAAAEAMDAADRKAQRSRGLLEVINPLLSTSDALDNLERWLHEHADRQRELETLASLAKIADSPDLLARQQVVDAAEQAMKTAQKAMLAASEEMGRHENAAKVARATFVDLADKTDVVVRAATLAMALPYVDGAWMDEKRREMEADSKSVVEMIQACRTKAQKAANAFGEHAATVRSELQQYATQYQYEITVDTTDPDAVKKALDEETDRLRESELHVYEQQAADAYTTSVRTFRSRIAASLRSSFDDMHGQLRELNSTMSRLPAFSNDEKYRFKYEVNPSSKALYDFIRAAAAAGADDDLFNDPLKTPEDFSLMLEGKDVATAALMEDYRRFFNFEVAVLHEGVQVDTFKNRMDKGSGGEHRAPLFIVAGASLAAAYGKLQGDTSGLSLIIFDELGDKIDSTNTRAVFEYLKSLGLQPVVAAPDDALSKIDESVDGYIEMYRDEDFLSIKHVRLGPDAVELLESDNWYKHPELLEQEIRTVMQEREGAA
jgi:chromosome segregation protein